MYLRQIHKDILRRLDALEEQYKIQENQVHNLLVLIKEYTKELDRRQRSYNNLLIKTGAAVTLVAFVPLWV
jgi:uncharacterized coiled-coil protein SlyX